jgi:hypothetical protein
MKAAKILKQKKKRKMREIVSLDNYVTPHGLTRVKIIPL